MSPPPLTTSSPATITSTPVTPTTIRPTTARTVTTATLTTSSASATCGRESVPCKSGYTCKNPQGGDPGLGETGDCVRDLLSKKRRLVAGNYFDEEQ